MYCHIEAILKNTIKFYFSFFYNEIFPSLLSQAIKTLLFQAIHKIPLLVRYGMVSTIWGVQNGYAYEGRKN